MNIFDDIEFPSNLHLFIFELNVDVMERTEHNQ